jgi:N-acetylglucosaminyl-diphospho-decaprenol L-rhamnosyltransferase
LNSKIYIVIVNFKTADLVMQCLASLNQQNNALKGGKVIVVDNNSQDESAEKLTYYVQKNHFNDWVDVLPMPRNGGFAYGCNAGINYVLNLDSTVDYVMLLNPDTLVRPNAIANLSNFMDANSHVGIAGSQLENSEGGTESSAHRFHTLISELLEGARFGLLSKLFSQFETTPPLKPGSFQCDWVSGASMMVRTQLIKDIGLFDEKFFLYFEEVDFFYRASKAGWQTWYVPAAKVMHIEGAATGIKSARRRPKYWYDSRRRFFIKHHGVLGLVCADILWGLGRFSYLIRRLLKLGAQGAAADPKFLVWDLLAGDAKAILTGEASV